MDSFVNNYVLIPYGRSDVICGVYAEKYGKTDLVCVDTADVALIATMVLATYGFVVIMGNLISFCFCKK
jgi:hypothetical protein